MGADLDRRKLRKNAAGRHAILPAVLVILFSLLAFGVPVRAGTSLTVHLFTVKGCTSCLEVKAYLAGMQHRVEGFELREYEVGYNATNADLLVQAAGIFGLPPSAIAAPLMFIGTCEPVTGYKGDDLTGKVIEERIRYCLEDGCDDPLAQILEGADSRILEASAIPPAEGDTDCADGSRSVISLPILGKTDVARFSLPR